ncbi:hypothetical protein LEP1GSC186_1390 [Leptospira noguchii serovar Autumnalis str. ZUN142]|uniref:Uncharacterized protein n=1 Tax=Leptospira noguchii serovar Autumnalis str. ZUN142 TaxID=1085540 RepID=M6UAN3_9LEPT|nr:hypothetical protein LEP1GSC186_1390 [Leptospira noguchii serovar Autumnalis str. ZUN142]
MLLPEVFKLKSACETVMSATFVISGKEILGGLISNLHLRFFFYLVKLLKK